MDTAINATYQMFRNDDNTAWIAVENSEMIFFASDKRYTKGEACALFRAEVEIRAKETPRLLPTETGYYAVAAVTR